MMMMLMMMMMMMLMLLLLLLMMMMTTMTTTMTMTTIFRLLSVILVIGDDTDDDVVYHDDSDDGDDNDDTEGEDDPAQNQCWGGGRSGETQSSERSRSRIVCLLVGCLTSQQQASVSQGRICSDNFTRCHTETDVADQTLYLTQSQYTDTGPTSPSADPITPGAWQGSHWSANFEVTGMTGPRKNPVASGIRTRDLPLSRRTP